MSIDIKGRMDKPRQNHGGSAGFGLRLTRKNKTTDEFDNTWIDVFCPSNCKNIEFVNESNAKKKVHITEGFLGVNTYNGESKPQVVCTALEVEDGVGSTAGVPHNEDIPF